jgi:predicted CXXCH cytochrome family protein
VHTANTKGSAHPFADCADCHRDHAGTSKSLTALADAACVRCHADLPIYAIETPSTAEHVTSFTASHPEFKAIEKGYRRKLTFSHSLHMTPGTWYGTKTDRARKLSDLPDSDRDRYRRPGQRDDELVQLECRSCHHLDGSATIRSDGRLFAPISFDRDCQACHSLRTIVSGDDSASYPLEPPHGQQTDVLASWLTRELTLAVVQDRTKGTDVKLFGGRLDPREREKIEQALKPRVESLTAAAKKKLFGSDGTCAKCHEIEEGKVVSPRIASVWLKKSWFDHASHRALDCAECPPGKTSVVKNGVTELGVPERLGIPGIETCRKCHGPASTGAAGVRAGCVDCHRYHNGDHPLEGRGSAAFDPVAKRTIEEWIKGR